jgi:hypothetical protein
LQFENGALGTLQFSINQSKAYSVRQLAGDRGLIAIQDVHSLTDDEDDEILLGRYGGTLFSIASQLPGDGDQPETEWKKIRLSDSSALAHQAELDNPSNRFGLGRKMEHPMAHAALMNSFIDAILTGGDPLVSGKSARSSVEVINALLLSAIRKKVVQLPIDPQEYDDLARDLSERSARVPSFR